MAINTLTLANQQFPPLGSLEWSTIFRGFIANLVDHSAELGEKPVKFICTPDQQKALEDICQALTNIPVLYIPVFSV